MNIDLPWTPPPDQPKLFFFWLIVVLVSISFLVISFILISRAQKSFSTHRNVRLGKKFQDLVNALVFMDSFQEISNSPELKQLREAITTASAKQLLINQLLKLKKNLAGSSTHNLDFLFQNLELDRYSLRKVNAGGSWKTRAEGILELSVFNIKSSIPHIKKFLNSRQETVREEAFIAMIRLDPELSLTFLDSYTARVSPWMRVRIHHYLTTVDARSLPQFSKWFNHPVLDVALFSMSMARQFRQLSTVPFFREMIRANDARKIGPAIKALGEMGAYEAIDDIVAIIDFYKNDKKTTLRIIRCLGELAHDHHHHQVIAQFLVYPFFEVRIEAARVLQKLNPRALESLATDKPELRGMLRHVNEPLLQY